MNQSRTLADTFDPRRNSLNAIRLGLAVLVIVSHSWPIGGYGQDPGQGPQESNLGAWSVAGFFAISGYLITASRLNSRSLWDYLWRRFLRIYPAFFVVLSIVGFVFAPLSTSLDAGATWSPSSGALFVLRNITLVITSYAPQHNLIGVPLPGAWIGALWTLAYEFVCYLFIGVLVSFIKRRTPLTAILAATVVLATGFSLVELVRNSASGSRLDLLIRLGAFFAAGALCYLLRERVPISVGLAATAGVLLVGLVVIGAFQALAAVPVAYLMMYLGARLPLERIGARNDVSYGMYIYGFPVQQWLALIVGARVLPVPLFALLSVLSTIPFAWASWLLIEKPAMRWKSLTAKREPDREGHLESPETPSTHDQARAAHRHERKGGTRSIG